MRPYVAAFLLLVVPGCRPGPPAEPPGLKAAETLRDEGRWGEALREVRKVPLADLVLPGMRLRAARVAVDGRDPALAAKILEPDAGTTARSIAPARILRAESLLRSGDLEGSRKALADIERDGHRDDRWTYVYALHCIVRGEKDIGVRDLGELVGKGCLDPDVLARWAETEPTVIDEARRRLKAALDRGVDKGAERGALLGAFGATLLMGHALPESARPALEEAVKLRPWDRDARMNLARASRLFGGTAGASKAAEEAERILAQDPRDSDARLLLAEVLGERGRGRLAPGQAVLGPDTLRDWERAEKEYRALLGAGGLDPVTAVRALQGLARIHVEEIVLDPPNAATGPGSHYARAVELLDQARSLDPQARLPGGPNRSLLAAETYYLLGRAARKAHTGTSDHTVALGWLQKAYDTDHRHLDSSWDLGLMCTDFFPDSKEYQQKAAHAFRVHMNQRDMAGLPALDPERLAIVDKAMAKAGTKRMPEPDGLPPPPGNQQQPQPPKK